MIKFVLVGDRVRSMSQCHKVGAAKIVCILKPGEAVDVSLQPQKNPGVSQGAVASADDDDVVLAELVVVIGPGSGSVVVTTLVVGSLQPNHPGVLQIEVV